VGRRSPNGDVVVKIFIRGNTGCTKPKAREWPVPRKREKEVARATVTPVTEGNGRERRTRNESRAGTRRRIRPGRCDMSFQKIVDEEVPSAGHGLKARLRMRLCHGCKVQTDLPGQPYKQFTG
jgi:hypothetical protein